MPGVMSCGLSPLNGGGIPSPAPVKVCKMKRLKGIDISQHTLYFAPSKKVRLLFIFSITLH